MSRADELRALAGQVVNGDRVTPELVLGLLGEDAYVKRAVGSAFSDFSSMDKCEELHSEVLGDRWQWLIWPDNVSISNRFGLSFVVTAYGAAEAWRAAILFALAAEAEAQS